jgi:hypothetical protein
MRLNLEKHEALWALRWNFPTAGTTSKLSGKNKPGDFSTLDKKFLCHWQATS